MAILIVEPRARRSMRRTLDYGRREFGLIAQRNLRQRIERTTELLAGHPQLGKIEPLLTGRRYEYRSIVVHKLFKMIYRVDEVRDAIYIVDFWDTRREPQQLDEETK